MVPALHWMPLCVDYCPFFICMLWLNYTLIGMTNVPNQMQIFYVFAHVGERQ